MFLHLINRRHLLRAALSTAPLVAASSSGLRAQDPVADRPWFGFSLSCTECSRTETRAGERWSFSLPPELLAIEPGSPAAGAGLRAGDVLTHVGGVSLTTEAGTERLAMVRPGQSVAFTAIRGGGRFDVIVRAAVQRISVGSIEPPRTETRDPSRLPLTEPGPPVRYAGPFGNADVVVRGPANTTVLMAERECWMEIRAGGAVIRLSLGDGCGRAIR
jgi:membrane-associated protease RseP (regulator of RpoE activity)